MLGPSLWKQFKLFCVEIGYVQSAEDIEELCPNVPVEFPQYIALWIMNKYVLPLSYVCTSC